MTTQSLDVSHVVSAIVGTYFSCHLFFGIVHYGCRRSGGVWHDGFTRSLIITHTIVFGVASVQYVARAFLVPRYWHQDQQQQDNNSEYPWDGRILLLYYESCILSFFIILTVAALYVALQNRQARERCAETVEGSINDDEDHDECPV